VDRTFTLFFTLALGSKFNILFVLVSHQRLWVLNFTCFWLCYLANRYVRQIIPRYCIVERAVLHHIFGCSLIGFLLGIHILVHCERFYVSNLFVVIGGKELVGSLSSIHSYDPEFHPFVSIVGKVF